MLHILTFMSSRQSGWVLFYGLIIAAWVGLYSMVQSTAQLHHQSFATIFLMWLLMAGAMMAPTFVPSLRVFDDLTRKQQGAGFWPLIAGYLLAWLGFSTIAAMAQSWLAGQGWIIGDRINVDWLNAGLLIAAGLYQFSTFKNACLSKCRQPLTFFMQHWESGPMKMGLRLGLVCVGCCWLLMLLGFVGGAMDLRWMGLATLLMVVEKMPDIGRLITRPLGGILIIAGAIVALV